jgi:hypothetical protein
MTQSTSVTVDTAHARTIVTPTYTAADTTPAVIIQRTEDAGFSWQNVRGDLDDGLVSMLGSTSRQIPDYEIPFDTLVQYRTIKSDVNGNPNGSTFNLSATVQLASTSQCLWWVHPVDHPNLIGGFVPVGDGPATLDAERGIPYGVGAVFPIPQLGVRQARSNAPIAFLARSNAERDDLVAALGASSVICVRGPSRHGWARRYVIVGSIRETHHIPVQAQAWTISAPYWEVQRTTEAAEAFGATYDDLAAGFATYAALRAGFGTFDEQTIGLT